MIVVAKWFFSAKISPFRSAPVDMTRLGEIFKRTINGIWTAWKIIVHCPFYSCVGMKKELPCARQFSFYSLIPQSWYIRSLESLVVSRKYLRNMAARASSCISPMLTRLAAP